MDSNRKIDPDTPNLLVKYRLLVREAIKKGTREALLMHKRAGNPVAVWRDGKVVLLEPDEIILDES